MDADKNAKKTIGDGLKTISGTYDLKDFLLQNNGIFLHPAESEIIYKDGGEKYVLEALKSAKDLSSYSRDLGCRIKDWPSRYHLSYRRSNFLEAISPLFRQNSRVLEIGSGCGAITRWLGERFEEVDALEGSYARALATRYRTSGMENVNVYCGDVLETSFDRKYDIVTLIGVLEYVPFYDRNNNDAATSCIALLKRISESLSGQGMLVLAIENKLGVKYLSGCTEDHTGKLFDGVAGYPDKSAVTFSRTELEKILKAAGFSNIQFYHLFPDYKLTDTVILEEKEVETLRPYNWIKTPFEDYTGNRLYFLPELLMLKSMTDAGLLWQFSNSFLVLASRSDSASLKPEWQIKKFYNSEAHDPKFHHVITLENTDSCQHNVRRYPLAGGKSKVDLGNIQFELVSQEYVEGELLSTEFYRSLLKKDREGSVKSVLKKLNDGLIEHYGTGRLDDGYPLVKGDAIDYTFWNVLSGRDGKLAFIDRKWKFKDDIPADFVLFRTLYYAFNGIIPYVSQKDRVRFIIDNIKELYPGYDEERLIKNLKYEEAFQSAVYNKKVELSLKAPTLYSISEQAFMSHLMDETISERDTRISVLNGEVRKISAAASEKDDRIRTLEDELGRMKRSTVWRLIRAFDRVAGRIMPAGSRRGRLYGALLQRLQGTKGKASNVNNINANDTGDQELIKNKYSASKNSKFDVICFPIINWDFRYQRPQQLLSRFARNGHRVFYLTVELEPMAENYRIREIEPNVLEIRLSISAPFNVYKDALSAGQIDSLLASFGCLKKDMNIEKAVCFVEFPGWQPLVQKLKEANGWKLVFDCLDEYTGFSNVGDRISKAEKSLIEESDLLVTTSSYLFKKTGNSRNSMLSPNAGDYDHFSDPPQNDILKDVNKPIIGYYGAISDWFDCELIEYMATKRPEWSFVLIGSTFGANMSRIEKLNNVHLLGEKPYGELPTYLYWFDVCLIPFKLTPLIEATHPVKFYEYLAPGKPIVVTRMPELLPYQDLCYIADSREDFLNKVEMALHEGPGLKHKRKDFAMRNTWDDRYRAIASRIEGLYSPAAAVLKGRTEPLVSVVIVNWNGLKYIRDCLDSLLRQTYTRHEIILVDNASSDGSTELVRKEYPMVRVIDSGANLGFAGGVNIGIKATSGELVALFNQDAIADERWLERLVERIEESDDVAGVAGKVYYWTGKHSDKIFCSWPKIDPVTAYAYNYYGNEPEAEVDYLTGCAMLVKKKVIDEIGLLDEGYFLYFEETDWCARAIRAGYKLIYVPEAPVWHVVSASSSGSDLKLKYITRNRIRFALKNFDRGYIPKFLWAYTMETVDEAKKAIHSRDFKELKIRIGAIGWNILNVPSTINTRHRDLSRIKDGRSYNRSLPLRDLKLIR